MFPRILPLVFLLLSCLCATPGDLLWSFDNGSDVYSTPAIGENGVAYYGVSGTAGDTSGSNRLVALDISGSSPVKHWASSVALAGDWVDASPVLSADGATIYVPSWDNNLYAFDAGTGEKKWTYTFSNYILASPALASDGTIYVGSGDGSLYAINPSGTLKWSYLASDLIESSPAVAPNGNVVGATLNGEVFELDASGKLQWSFTVDTVTGLNSDIRSSPVLDAAGNVYVGSANHFFYALDSSGQLRWSFEASGAVDSTAAIGPEGNVYFASRGGDFYAFDSEGGVLWYQLIGDIYYSSAAVDTEGNVYIPAYSGSGTTTVYAYGSDGALLWSTLLNTVTDSSPVITSGGVLLLGGYSNYLYAIETGVAGGTTGWPQFRHDASNTARMVGGTAPVIDAFTAVRLSAKGETLTLSDSASGTAPLSYLWRKDGQILGITSQPVWSLKNITTSDAGDYSLTVLNDFGAATSLTSIAVVDGMSVVSGMADYTYYCPTTAASSVLPQVSTDLLNWSSAGLIKNVDGESNGVQTIRCSVPIQSYDRLFMRLSYTSP